MPPPDESRKLRPASVLLTAAAIVALIVLRLALSRMETGEPPPLPRPSPFTASPPVHEMPRSGHWPKVRAEHLQHEPACAVCGVAHDLQVHHVIPYHVRPDLELVQENLITLCGPDAHNCHWLVGHAGNFRGWNPNVREDAELLRKRFQESKRLAGTK